MGYSSSLELGASAMACRACRAARSRKCRGRRAASRRKRSGRQGGVVGGWRWGVDRVRVGDAMICAESQHTIFGRRGGQAERQVSAISDSD